VIDRLPLRLRRAVFWVFVCAIFTATHWPRLKIDFRGIERPDLLIHFAVFGCWALLVHFTGYLGPIRSSRTVARSWFATTIYACIDEALQLPTFIHRHAAWDDLAANIGGATLALSGVAVWILITNRLKRKRADT